MKINRENYEAYFLDYLENNLSPELVAELMVFLDHNPDLKPELELFENIQLEPEDSIRFEGKKVLLKKELKRTENISEENYEEVMVARLEGDLPDDQSEELNRFLNNNPHLKLEYNILKQTFLTAPEIQLQDKDSLKKKGIWVSCRKPVIYTLFAAASILLLVGLFFIFNPTERNRFAINSYRYEIQKMDHLGFAGFGNEFSYRKVSMEASVEKKVNIVSTEPGNEAMKRFTTPELLVAKNILSLESPQDISVSYIENKRISAETIAFASESEETEGSFFGRFIAGFAGNLLPDRDQEKKSFIEFTVDGYNFISDRDVEVEKHLDEYGNVIAYNVKGDNINYTRRVKKPSAE